MIFILMFFLGIAVFFFYHTSIPQPKTQQKIVIANTPVPTKPTTRPSGMNELQDKKLGYTFTYPNNLTCKDEDDVYFCTLKNAPSDEKAHYVKIENVYGYNHFPSFEENIKNYASLSCDAGGPMGSQRCPVENIQIETLKNSSGISEYKIPRKIVIEKYNANQQKSVESSTDTVYFYKTDTPKYLAVMFSDDAPSMDTYLQTLANSFTSLPQK